jgi:ABC-type glycerol-3-phosphate transport system substrate-binding protein
MAINAQTDMPDEAWAFAQFMTDEENLKYRAIEGGYIPGRSSLLNDPEVEEANPIVGLAKEILLDNATSRPVTEYYGDMSLEMAEQFNTTLKGDVSPQQAVKTLQKSLSNIMEQAE